MGLLDGMFGGSAGQQGLLAGSMALLNAGGPSRMPISLGQALGQGMGAGQQAYQQAMKQKQAEEEAALQRQQREQEFALTKQYREAQIKKMQDDAAARGRMDTTLQGLLSGGAPSSPDALEQVGTTMLLGGDPRGSGVLSLAQQRRAAAERSGEMKSFTATGTTNQNPTPEEAAIPVQAGAAERFMGPEAAQIPGLQQRAMALGNFIQKNPGADPKVVRAELAELDKMVANYNSKMTTQNASAEREEQRRQDKLDAEQRAADLRRDLAPPRDGTDKPPSGYRFKGDGSLEPIPGGPADKRLEQASGGREQVSNAVTSLRDIYSQLSKGGGIVDADKGAGSNISARISSTGVGQFAGQLLGTKNQKFRDTIEQQRPLLLQAIKNATGMSAKQMDSNVELKMYLAAATDPTKDIKANLDALDNLERLFGVTAGQAAPKAKPSTVDSLPTANASNKGRRARDTATGTIFRSNGVSWVEEK